LALSNFYFEGMSKRGMKFFELSRPGGPNISLAEQRKQWLPNFLKTFSVVFFVYFTMYLLRNNHKGGGQLAIIEQFHMSKQQLGDLTVLNGVFYGVGKTALGFMIDGKNTKRIVSFLLLLSAICNVVVGIALLAVGMTQAGMLVFTCFWGMSGLFQSPGGPASYSTIMRWVPKSKQGHWTGIWNTSHNVGGAIAGILAGWFATTFFAHHAAGYYIGPAIIGIVIGVWGMFFGKDDPEELGWNDAATIWGEEKDEEEIKEEAEEKHDKPSKWQIVRNYVINNPWVWFLSFTNLFVYVVRFGIDTWLSSYAKEVLHISNAGGLLMTFEIGAFFGSLSWGWLSDFLKGRRMLTALIAFVLEFGGVYLYAHAHNEMWLNIALFVTGFLIFGPQLLIGVSVVNFVP